jgi:perosamine synthetase
MEFNNTHISKKVIELVNQTLNKTRVSAGKMADEFEKALENKLELVNPVSVNSGTSALHLALAVAGIKQGDEVILPAQTFVATGLVILMQNAKPVFADVDPMDGNLSPLSFKEKITPKTKVVMPVHYGGYPCDMDEINRIAKQNGIAVIEDAAQALGARYKGSTVGSLSDFTAFSFQATKHLTTGDGGVLCCMKNEDKETAKRLRWFGIDRENDKANSLGEREFNLKQLGYKYHMNDVAAAIGLGNLSDFPERLKRRRSIAEFYINNLRDVKGITLQEIKDDREHAYWLFTIHVEKRQDFIDKMTSRGIPVSVVHTRIDKHEIFGGIRKKLVGQEKFNMTNVCIPMHEALTDEDIEKVVKNIKSGW